MIRSTPEPGIGGSNSGASSMSVTFSMLDCPHDQEDPWECPQCDPLFVNMSNSNALNIMALVGIEPSLTGTIRATVLAGKCRQALTRMERGDFGDLAGVYEPDYCLSRVRQLLTLAVAARSGEVAWD